MLRYCVGITVCLIQVQGFEEARHKFGRAGHYNGLVDCVVSVVRQEGMTGLYKGGYPALIKVDIMIV